MLWSGFPGCHDRTWATPCRAWVTLEEVYVPVGAETHPKNISGTSGNKYFITSDLFSIFCCCCDPPSPLIFHDLGEPQDWCKFSPWGAQVSVFLKCGQKMLPTQRLESLAPSSQGVRRKTGYLGLRTRRVFSRELIFMTVRSS